MDALDFLVQALGWLTLCAIISGGTYAGICRLAGVPLFYVNEHVPSLDGEEDSR